VQVEGINNSINLISMRPEFNNSSQLKVGESLKADNFSVSDFGEDLKQNQDRLSGEDFKGLIEGLDRVSVEIKNTRFEFSIHEETKRVIVRVYDKNTGKLISEIPPEKFLDLIANIWKQVGLIVDKKV